MRHEAKKFHLLVQVGNEPLEFYPGETMTIGRSVDCALSIPSQRVSRLHAEIFWDDKKPVLKDLGSENGTLVNGRTIREHRLKDGDVFAVGPYSCVYRCLSDERSVARLLLLGAGSLGDTVVAEDTLRGNLEQVSLIEVLGMLEKGAKTGTLEILDTDHNDGKIVVDAGRPVHAQATDLTGIEALFTLLEEERGKFCFTEGAVQVEPTIQDTTITGLLFQHARRIDERFTMRMKIADLGDLEAEDP